MLNKELMSTENNMEGPELVVEGKTLSQTWPLKQVKNQVQSLVRKTWLQYKYQIKDMTIRFLVKTFQNNSGAT